MKRMDRNLTQFYKDLFHNTGGYSPCGPLLEVVYPGDFFQIVEGKMVVLGNIYKMGFVDHDEIEIGNPTPLNPKQWNTKSGVTVPYLAKGDGVNVFEGEVDFFREIIQFENRGSYAFLANSPELIKILNWNEIRNGILIKLVQTEFSFRDVYVVTECVTASEWTLAVAASNDAEIKIEKRSSEGYKGSFFGDREKNVSESKNLAFYHQEKNRKSNFFKAQRIVPNYDALEEYRQTRTLNTEPKCKWVKEFYDYNFTCDPSHVAVPITAYSYGINLLKGNVLNANTALHYFEWQTFGLKDLERLC
jgi:hypothetical protein